MKKKEKKLYKFLRTGLKSQHGEKKWKIGEWYKEEEVSICNSGFHASKTPLQAFGYVQGEILAEVSVRGESVIEDDKECWSEMKIVKAWHWKKEDSVALSIFSAEQVLKNFEKAFPNDKRPREAIEAAKKWLADPTEENRSAAWSAARSAAESARSAEGSAWSAAESARSAARSARSAWSAWSARSAWSAARSAAESARSARLRSSIDKWFMTHIKKLEPYA